MNKRFNFRRQLVGLNRDELLKLRDYHLDISWSFIGYDESKAQRHGKYVSQIDNKLKKTT